VASEGIIFSVKDRWGYEVVLTEAAWQHATKRHPELIGNESLIECAVMMPTLVYETPHKRPSKGFYAKGLLGDPPFRGCYVAVFVRYTTNPAVVVTAYFVRRLSANPGKLLHADR
jgi:hypothetical protein